ncbi:MAG: HupE/UreJ family protein [Acidobacteriota bacterium]
MAVLCVPGNPAAHEIGTTRVTARFDRSGSYQIDVVCDPESLLAKLETQARQPRSGTLSAAEYQIKIDALQSYFLRQAKIAFDGTPAQPAFAYLAPASAPAPEPQSLGVPAAATIRLTGQLPARASTFTWSYGLTYSAYALSVAHDAGSTTEWLEGGNASRPFALDQVLRPPSRRQIAGRYFVLGFTHIIPKGLDHILFVLGIFLLSRRLRPVLWQVSAFTIAHSLTLGLTIYGVLSVAPAVVEPLIALSIAYVAIENLVTSELKPWRVGLVFAFGLLHGMGFAGVLRELGLPRSEFVTALLTFNAGVEAGQLAVIGAATLAVAHWYSGREWYRRRIVLPGSAFIAATGIYWTVERLMAAHLLPRG